jgi:signal transduction histidine kinase
MQPSFQGGELYRQIAEASLDKPESFPAHVARILHDFFPIKAASVYSYEPDANTLTLRAQRGMDYRLYDSFEIPITTVAGSAVALNETIKCPDIRQHANFHNRKLIPAFGLRALISVPLSLPTTQVQEGRELQPTGALCVYPDKAADIDKIASVLNEISPFVTLLYHASLDHRKIRLREQLIKKVGYSHDMGGLLYRVIHEFRELFNVEAGSIFLFDDKTGFLRMRATTGLSGKERAMVYYGSDSSDPTYGCFIGKERRVITASQFAFDAQHPLERTAHVRENCVLQPLPEAAVQFNVEAKVLGVIRAFNHFVRHEGVSRLTSFGWEEIKLVDFFAELTAVMIHFMKKGDLAKHDFERRMHGAKNNLQAVQFTLELLEQAEVAIPSFMESRSVSNAISHVSDIRSQISRLDQLRGTLEMSKVALYGDVLAKVPSIVHSLANIYQIGEFRVTNLKAAGFDQLPFVRGNAAALLSVFRNLAENAVKYSDPKKRRHSFELAFSVEHKTLRIFVRNDGVEIPDKDRDMIFVEGFRCDDAIARYPSSSGLGLSDSRELMQKMRGTLTYLPEEAQTTFCVQLPI